MTDAIVTLRTPLDELVTLNVPVVLGPDGSLPSEVRILRKGWNATEKGEFLFDDVAAKSVIDHASAHGVRIMIDLEHLSLDDSCVNYDPDPRAWCTFAVRDGDLWLVGIKWLADGERRLKGDLQPYLSPAFKSDEDGRVVFVRNVAMTSMPATHGAPLLVAASLRGRTMDPKQLIAMLAKLRPTSTLSARAMHVLLAAAAGEEADGGEAPAGKWATVVKCASDAIKALQDVGKAKDPDAAFGAAKTAQEAVDAFEDAFAALSGGGQDADAPGTEAPVTQSAGDPAPTPDQEKKMRADMAELKRLRAVAVEHEQMIAKQAAERLVLEQGERRRLVGDMVACGAETPALAWSDDAGTVPAEPWASMPLETLRVRVEKLSGASRVPANVGHPRDSGAAVQTSGANISSHELNKLRAVYDRENRQAPQEARRDFDAVVRLLASHKNRQMETAAAKGDRALAHRFSRAIDEVDCLTTANGDLVRLASVAVAPIAQMGASTQRALEEFRLEFNATLVSQPIPWAESLGVVLPGGSLKDTYPISFFSLKYRSTKGENPPAATPHSRDISIVKRPFSSAATAELIRITHNDFAYIQRWNMNAAEMARARINLRNYLAVGLLTDTDEDGNAIANGGALTGYWGKTADQATGIDGQPFFSASHLVNPFDPKVKFHGSTTWGNYVATAYPLSANGAASNLTTAKALMLLVPGPDGQELGSSATGILHPTSLKERARLLLTVQDLIIDAAASLKSVSNVMGGGTRNEHFQSGFEAVWGPQLSGSDLTADYYLFSRETIARGMPPFIIAEDAAEEIRIWDENSDFYKNSGFIKIASHVLCAGGLAYPHGIRLVKGA